MEIEKKCCEYKLTENYCKSDIIDHISADLLEILHKVAKKEGFIKYNIDVKRITADGGNYLGVLYEVTIKDQTLNKDKELNIFTKYTIDGENQIIISLTEAYMKESFAYNELAKIFTDCQNQAKVPIDERLNMVKCYDANLKMILLENLVKKGFKTYHRMEVMPLTFAELSIEQLARFHGLFYVLQKQMPEFFSKNLAIYEQQFICNKHWEEFMIRNSKSTIQSLDEDLKQRVLKFIPKVNYLYKKYMVEKNEKYLTICHGDYRINNIMAKETNGKTTEVIPVDYQLLYYGCPVNDFIYFLYTGTDREFRKRHLDSLKNLYHNSLTKFLNYFNLDVNEIYPRNEFERQFKERLLLGLVQTLHVTPFLFVDEDKATDIVNEDFTNIDFVLDPRGHDRVKCNLEDFIELGLL